MCLQSQLSRIQQQSELLIQNEIPFNFLKSSSYDEGLCAMHVWDTRQKDEFRLAIGIYCFIAIVIHIVPCVFLQFTIILMIVFKHIKGSLCCFFCSKGKEGLLGQCLPRLYLQIFMQYSIKCLIQVVITKKGNVQLIRSCSLYYCCFC